MSTQRVSRVLAVVRFYRHQMAKCSRYRAVAKSCLNRTYVSDASNNRAEGVTLPSDIKWQLCFIRRSERNIAFEVNVFNDVFKYCVHLFVGHA
jgi:hypothetical protein